MIKKKRKTSIIFMIIFILFIKINVSLASSGDYWFSNSNDGNWQQGSDWYSSGHFARDFQSKFFNVDASKLIGKNLWADRDFVSNEPAVCIGGIDPEWWTSTPVHRIEGIIDINYDGPNTVNIYKNGSSVRKIAGNKWYNAMAEVAKDASGHYIQDNTYGKGYLGAAFAKIMIQNLIGEFKNILGVNPVASTPYAGNTYNYLSYYNNAVKNGENVANNASTSNFSHTSDYDPSEVSLIKDGSDYYIGPLKYSNDKNIKFNSIEITGKNGSTSVYTKTIKNVNKDVLFVKNSKNKYVGKDSIGKNTAFYIKVDNNVNNASKVTVKITAGAGQITYSKARIVILKSIGRLSVQNFAVYGGTSISKDQDASITFECEHDKGALRIVKKGISTSEEPISMNFRIYYLSGKNKKYLKLTTKDNITSGSMTIKTQEGVDNANNATIVTTKSDTGIVILNNINTGDYYIEEITDGSNYSSNIVYAQMQVGTGDWTDIKSKVKGNTIGPITVYKKPDVTRTSISLKDDIKRGKLTIKKRDTDTKEKITGVGFKIKFGSVWVKATKVKDGSYTLKTYKNYNSNKKYYEDNFVEDKADATEFETNSDGEIIIEGLDKGTYKIEETKAPADYAKNQITSAKVKVGNEAEKDATITKGKTFSAKVEEETHTVVTCYNKKQKGNLTIYKIDWDLRTTDVEASFVLKENDKYLKLNNLSEITGDTDITTKKTVDSASQATKITISDESITLGIKKRNLLF